MNFGKFTSLKQYFFLKGFLFVSKKVALTAPIFKAQIFGTRKKLSFGLTPMANQTYPQDGLMCGVKLCSGDHSQRITRFARIL